MRRQRAAIGLEREAGPARKSQPPQRIAKTSRRGCPVSVPAVIASPIEPYREERLQVFRRC